MQKGAFARCKSGRIHLLFLCSFRLDRKKGRVTLCLLVTSVLPADIFVKPLSEYNFTYIILLYVYNFTTKPTDFQSFLRKSRMPN